MVQILVAPYEARAMVALREFKHQSPSMFKADPNPMMAEEWLEEIEMILDTLDITNEAIRVQLAAYQIAGEPKQWWKMMKEARANQTIRSKEFKEMFLAHYFPTIIRQQKVNEFLNLTQGSGTVVHYLAKFNALARLL